MAVSRETIEILLQAKGDTQVASALGRVRDELKKTDQAAGGLKGMKQAFGEESGLGMLVKTMKGAGAVAGITMGLRTVIGLSDKLADSFSVSATAVGDLHTRMAQFVESLPLMGDTVKSANRWLGLEDMTEEARRITTGRAAAAGLMARYRNLQIENDYATAMRRYSGPTSTILALERERDLWRERMARERAGYEVQRTRATSFEERAAIDKLLGDGATGDIGELSRQVREGEARFQQQLDEAQRKLGALERGFYRRLFASIGNAAATGGRGVGAGLGSLWQAMLNQPKPAGVGAMMSPGLLESRFLTGNNMQKQQEASQATIDLRAIGKAMLANSKTQLQALESIGKAIGKGASVLVEAF